MVTVENEAFIRTFHPAFINVSDVYVRQEMNGNSIWIVFLSSNPRVSHTHAGGREIHIIPRADKPHPLRYMMPKTVPILRFIYPRRMLTAADIMIIKAAFPLSVGIRVLVSGFAILLFRSKKDTEKTWEKGIPDDIGGLDLAYDIISAEPSVDTGHNVTNEPNSFESRGCLGLKLQDGKGQEAITTTTHGFVKLPGHSRAILRMAGWIARAKHSLAQFISPKTTTNTVPGEVEMRDVPSAQPLGKKVYLAGSAEIVSRDCTNNVYYQVNDTDLILDS